MTDNSTFDDIISFDCDTSFNEKWEILKYFGSILYLIPGFVLHILILKSILVTERKAFKGSSFFAIFVMDSMASSYLLLSDICFSRLFLYIPPLCPLIGPFFFSPSLILNFYYITTIHARLLKPIAQIFMVLNRMSCVLMPMSYSNLWKNLFPFVVTLVVLGPLGGNWNVIISRIYVIPSYGGFAVNYIKTVKWAALSLFQSIYILTALVFTVICTSITLFKLIFLPDRIKSAERSLCFTSIFISMAFLLVAATTLCYVFCPTCAIEDWLFNAQYLAFDFLNVGSAVIMILTNDQLREAIFSSGRAANDRDRAFQRSSNNSSLHT